MKILNLTEEDLDLGFSETPEIKETLELFKSLWETGKLVTYVHPKNSPKMSDVDYLLSLVELRRLMKVKGNVDKNLSSRLTTLDVSDELQQRLSDNLRPFFPEVKNVFSGSFWYRSDGFMSWHTNSNSPGIRMYVTYAEEPGKSYFRYFDDSLGEVKTSLDDLGWQFRIFKVSKTQPLWHCVKSQTNRLSFGLRLKDIVE